MVYLVRMTLVFLNADWLLVPIPKRNGGLLSHFGGMLRELFRSVILEKALLLMVAEISDVVTEISI